MRSLSPQALDRLVRSNRQLKISLLVTSAAVLIIWWRTGMASSQVRLPGIVVPLPAPPR